MRKKNNYTILFRDSGRRIYRDHNYIICEDLDENKIDHKQKILHDLTNYDYRAFDNELGFYAIKIQYILEKKCKWKEYIGQISIFEIMNEFKSLNNFIKRNSIHYLKNLDIDLFKIKRYLKYLIDDYNENIYQYKEYPASLDREHIDYIISGYDRCYYCYDDRFLYNKENSIIKSLWEKKFIKSFKKLKL